MASQQTGKARVENPLPNRIVHSAIYTGEVQHKRLLPNTHAFRYKLAMVYLDLDELDAVFALHPAWSLNTKNLAAFHRQDYHHKPTVNLKTAVLATVAAVSGEQLDGPVRMLSNLRYFGYIMNPLTCYYCFDKQEKLQYIVADVTNTPWRERHSYVLPASQEGKHTQVEFAKQMHVSPFMPMDMTYKFCTDIPSDNLFIYMENQLQQELQFTAGLHLQKLAMTHANMSRLLWYYPVMTLQVAWGIYWQACKLWWKRTPVFAHPKKSQTKTRVKVDP